MPIQFNTRKIEMYRDCEQVTRVYPPGHQLFAEGDTPEGVFLLGTGRVKLYSTAAQGKVFITKIASSRPHTTDPLPIDGEPVRGTGRGRSGAKWTSI